MQIHIIGSIVMALISIVIFTFLSIIYWQNIRSIKSYQKYILISLRTTTLFFILFLILDPWVQWTKKNEIKEQLSIYLDSSISMEKQLFYDDMKISNLKSEIDSWSDKNNVSSEWYLFGESIRKASIRDIGIFRDSISDFSELPNHALINNGEQLILITDGQSNRNKDIRHLDFDEGLKINVIGVGSDQKLNDIWIENIVVPPNIFIEDSVNIKITLGYELFQSVNGELIFNISNKDNYSFPLQIPLGEGLIDFEKSFLAAQILELNQIEVRSDLIESNMQNNRELINIEVKKYKKGILLISSGLSPNTQLIKSLIEELPPHTLIHLYKKNNLEWNLNLSNVMNDSSIQLVVFDDFPGTKNDSQIYQRISENVLWKNSTQIYIEGPKSNASTAEILSNKLDLSVKIKDSINDLKIDYFNESSVLKPVDISSIPPTKKQMVWKSDASSIIYGFDDSSAGIIQLNKFYGVFIQDAQEVILSESKSNQSILRTIFSNLLLHAFIGDEGLLVLNAEKQKYMANSPITFNVEKSKVLDDGLIRIQINDSGGNNIDEIVLSRTESNSPSVFIATPGEYSAIAFLGIDGVERIESQPFHFRIMKNLIEEDNLFENKDNLESLAWENGGTYTDPNHLDVILSTVNSRPKSQLKEYKFSALSTQRYWWILIILLSIEWLLRKREGLL